MLQLQWIKCQGGDWCSFLKVNLAAIKTEGVYIIWHGGNPSRVVYVGKGDVAARLQDHRTRKDILAYSQSGLYVTWAAVPAAQRDGVERFLADKWEPLVGDAHPQATPVAVNSPW